MQPRGLPPGQKATNATQQQPTQQAATAVKPEAANVDKAKVEKKLTTIDNIPKAPPITHFHAWVRGEPFGDSNDIEAIPTDNQMHLDDDLDVSHLSFMSDAMGEEPIVE